jgi:hypothetical protein
MVRNHGKADSLSAREYINAAIGTINKSFVKNNEPFIKPRKVLVLGSGGNLFIKSVS